VTQTFEGDIFKQNTYLHTDLSYFKAYYVTMIILTLPTSAGNSGDGCISAFFSGGLFGLERRPFKSVTMLLNNFSFYPRNLLNSYTDPFFLFLLIFSTFFLTLQHFFLCMNILVNIPLTRSKT